VLTELQRRGHHVIEEPGRRIVQQERYDAGQALPWKNAEAFAHRAIDTAIADREAARAKSGWIFFDRSIVDAASFLEHATGKPVLEKLGRQYRYHGTVFLTPPWPEIYVTDAERRHGFDAAVAEFERLQRDYPRLGYRAIVLPKTSVEERANFILTHLQA